ncbi:cupin-like domain-containing protein [Lasiosphaeria hispida]|uniref:Cupin-like domain-containing protein n=1 Tax=Lasiosphaeria hispida TaxID=260671 RepID=A0AAJ0MI53_9PEZI|nr:cupin-like domain-containing protein [Lasiosphaeria hispida]
MTGRIDSPSDSSINFATSLKSLVSRRKPKMAALHGADPITELITIYNELNSHIIIELDEEPSPLEFMRFVAKNTPFVVRGAAADWKATRTWTSGFLKSHLADETVNVAVTPAGNADAPTTYKDGSLVFAKPWEEDQPFPDFLDYVIRQEKRETENSEEIRYAQTQNDNLRNEYASLFSHVQQDIPFARIALEQESPDAINLWIGNSHSVTALHKDNYENLYVQVLGQKHFVLLPPHCQPCVNEQALRPAQYHRTQPREQNDDALELRLDVNDVNDDSGGNGAVPFATWDPDRPLENATAYSHLAEPVRVTLWPGDMLYLPCMWYHKVSQSCSPDDICVAVNYWYDMDFAGPLYPLSNFVRAANASSHNK